ncbi:translation initiation factor IF-6, partial [Candidatus Woesearchaeota archaeon]|nr:translation initiation factor IF-6 [Candidatus Woesearchaeota archaeon]
KIKYEVIKTKLTALGNNILASDEGCVVNPEFNKTQQKQIENALGVPVKITKIAGLSTVGALCVATKKGCLIHRDAQDSELELVEKTIGVEATIGTVNFGSPYIKSGLAANSNGFIIGNISGGPEIQNADRALGFIKT